MNIEERLFQLGKVFSPTSPIKEKDFFYGRKNQLQQIVDAVNQTGQHGIIYGERGVGKTSLANRIAKSLTNLYPAKITCNKQDTFKNIWKRVLNKVQYSKTTRGVGFKPTVQEHIISLGDFISNKKKVSVADIEGIIQSFPKTKFLLIFDEFDNITQNNIRSAFSDLIKTLSDNVDNITIVIVGIADNVENLIGNHQSLERCLMQINMPRMSDSELNEIITSGIDRLEMIIDEKVVKEIITFSSGFPHYTHLISKYTAKSALERQSIEINQEDLQKAIEKSIENTNEQLRMTYRKAIISTSSTSQWKDVLFACALAESDEFNCFSTTDILVQFNKTTGKDSKRENITYNLGKFCKEERGAVIEKIGQGRNFKYRFTNPMLKPYIKLNMK